MKILNKNNFKKNQLAEKIKPKWWVAIRWNWVVDAPYFVNTTKTEFDTIHGVLTSIIGGVIKGRVFFQRGYQKI